MIFFLFKITGANEAALTRTENDFEAIISIANLLKRLNRKNETSFMEAVRNMTAFEQDLLKINSLDEGLELYNISQLSTMYPFLNWEDFFDDLFTQVELTSPINQTTEVLVEVRFFKFGGFFFLWFKAFYFPGTFSTRTEQIGFEIP